jgi:hypothetical protein
MGWIAHFLDISLDRANQFYAWGWRASVLGAVITMCGVGLLWLGTRVRDHDFETQMGTLASTTAGTLERAGKLELDAEQLRSSNLKLQADVERERAARLRLEAKLEPRRLTKEQQIAISDKMKKWEKVSDRPDAESQSANVFPLPPSFESAQLAGHISTALTAANWRVSTHPVLGGIGEFALKGVGIIVPMSNKRAFEIATSLVEALRNANIVAGILDVRRRGCEETGESPETMEKSSFCSSISVIIGNQP